MSKLTKVNVFKVPNKDDFGTRALVELIFNDDIIHRYGDTYIL